MVGREWTGWGLVLPIGISFYTFQTITYALDVYRRDEQPLDSLLDYLVYILSFPQMIAGPIVRFGKVEIAAVPLPWCTSRSTTSTR